MSSARGFRSEERQRRNSSPNAQTQGRKGSGRAKLVETAGQSATSPSALQSSLSPSPTPSGIVVRPWRQQGGRNNSLALSTQAQGNPNSQGSSHQVAESSSSSQSSGGVPLSPEESSNNLQVRSATRNASNNDLSPAESQDSYYLTSQTCQNISTSQAAQTSKITAGSRGDMSPQTTGSQLPLKFQVILHDIAENLKSSPFLPPSVQDQLNQKLDGLFHELTTSHHALRQNLSATKGDRDKYQIQLKEAYDQLAETIRDCKKITDERDALELRLRQLCLGPIKDDPHNGDSEKELQTINAELREQLRFKDEQLMGKRDLWMETHPDSAARRRRMRALPDPFNTPLQTATSRMGAGSGAGQDREFPSPDVKSPIRGPPSFMRLPSAPSGPSGSTSMRGPSESFASPIPSDRRGMRRRNILAHSPTTTNDPNSPIDPASLRRFNSDPSEAMAMVPFGANQDRSLEFKIDIGRLYQLVQDWATTYANLPDFESDQAIARSDHLLWEYMMNCTYPGQKEEAHARVVALLGDPATRVLFITRMAVTYCIQDIMSVETFKRFGFHATTSIDDVKIRLKEGGLATDARQVLIDKQVKVLLDMKASPRFNVFRHDQLTLHSKRLRDMLGPLLNKGCSRTQSCAAILAITTTAWELAFKMHTSHLSFKILFPETTAKFNSDSMIALGMTEDPYQLQCQQTRLNLVVTPVITLRDDRGTTIKVKNVCKADVLILT